MRHMIINIVGAGPEELLPNLKEFDQENSIWVGVDKGVSVLLSKGIIPTIGFGDFDSVTYDEWKKIEERIAGIKKFLPEKDETDMELALVWGLEQGAKEIRIFGGTGGRLDHFLANIQLILQPILQEKQTRITIIDRNNYIFALAPGEHHIAVIPEFKYVSFVPMTAAVKNLSLKGFKYPLTDCHIPLGSTLCISNELNNDSGTFSFDEGILMVIRSRD